MRYYLVLTHGLSRQELMTTSEVARQACVHPDLLEKMVDLGLIEPAQLKPQMLFTPDAVADACRAVRLRNQLGINWSGVGLVMDLLKRISELEREIKRLRND